MSDYRRSNTDWFYQAKWGVFTHYLGSEGQSADDWNKAVNSFDVKRLAKQLDAAGARYYFITIGQNSGHYCSPNSVYDELVGIMPSKLSKRDLIAEIAESLEPLGIKTMVYLPSQAPCNDLAALERLGCTPTWPCPCQPLQSKWKTAEGIDDRLTLFQQNWEAVIREWSLRWGNKVHGWWIDGCYHSDIMYRSADGPNFRTFAEALKSGNPDSIVAFNPGVFDPIFSLTEYEDYTAGECNGLPVTFRYTDKNKGRFVQGAQYHVFTYLGDWWSGSQPRFPDELAVGYTKYVNSFNGVMTWDVPITSDGRIPEAFLRQLSLLKEL